MEEYKLLLTLAIALLGGLLMSRVVKPLGMPAVTGYLLAGIVLGPYCLGALGLTGLFCSAEEMHGMANLIQQVALGFIAFAIGSEFKLSVLRKTGKQATVVGIVQAVFTMIVVDVVLIGLHFLLGEE